MQALVRILETVPPSKTPLLIRTDSKYSIQCQSDSHIVFVMLIAVRLQASRIGCQSGNATGSGQAQAKMSVI